MKEKNFKLSDFLSQNNNIKDKKLIAKGDKDINFEIIWKKVDKAVENVEKSIKIFGNK